MSENNSWQTLSSKEVYRNPWIRVREDEITHPSGKKGIYGVVEIPPGIFVVAQREDGCLAMIEQQHYPTGLTSWEFPGGGQKKDTTVEQQAREELREEALIDANRFVLLGKTQTQPGITTQVDSFVLATELTSADTSENRESQADEGIGRVAFFTVGEVEAMISDGRVSHGQTITALFLFLLKTRGTKA